MVWIAWKSFAILIFWGWFGYNQLKHHNYIQGIQNCQFCSLNPESTYIGKWKINQFSWYFSYFHSLYIYLQDLPKTFWKIESVNKAFLFWYWQRLKKFFFSNKTFLFFKIEGWNFQVQFEIEFRETLQNFNSISQPIKKDENKKSLNKLNELKICEVSRI